MGQGYYTIIVSTITMIAMVKLAFNISLYLSIFLFLIFLLGAFFLGYYLEKKGIRTHETLKAVEMTHRYVTIADKKRYEFEIILFSTLLEAIKKKDKFDMSILEKRYKNHLKKWSPK